MCKNDADMNDVVARLISWLVTHQPDALAEMAPGASEAELDAFAASVGGPLPDGFRALYRWRNGPQPRTLGFTIIHNRNLMSLADIADKRSYMRELVEGNQFEPNWWCTSWVPFLDNGAGSNLCWDAGESFGGSRGQVLEFWNRDSDRTIVAPSFDEWLTAFVDSLDAGVWTYTSGLVDDDPKGVAIENPPFAGFLARRFPGHPRRVVERGA